MSDCIQQNDLWRCSRCGHEGYNYEVRGENVVCPNCKSWAGKLEWMEPQ